jgi:hypothetical protein
MYQSVAELALLRLDGTPFEIPSKHGPNTRVRKARPKQCHAKPNRAGVAEVHVGDQLAATYPLKSARRDLSTEGVLNRPP